MSWAPRPARSIRTAPGARASSPMQSMRAAGASAPAGRTVARSRSGCAGARRPRTRSDAGWPDRPTGGRRSPATTRRRRWPACRTRRSAGRSRSASGIGELGGRGGRQTGRRSGRRPGPPPPRAGARSARRASRRRWRPSRDSGPRPPPPSGSRSGELLDQPGLADAGLAGEDHRAASTGGGLGGGAEQRVELALAPDEGPIVGTWRDDVDRGRHSDGGSRPWRRRSRGIEVGRLGEDVGLQATEVRAGLHAHLLDERRSRRRREASASRCRPAR